MKLIREKNDEIKSLRHRCCHTGQQSTSSCVGQNTGSSWTYLRDLLCDVVGPVNELAGSDDIHLPSGQGDERVRFEIHKIEGNLRDFGNGTVPHEVRV